MGVPIVIIHFNGISHYEPSIWGESHLWKPPFEEVSPNLPVFAHLETVREAENETKKVSAGAEQPKFETQTQSQEN